MYIFRSAPFQGHMERVKRTYAYLDKKVMRKSGYGQSILITQKYQIRNFIGNALYMNILSSYFLMMYQNT